MQNVKMLHKDFQGQIVKAILTTDSHINGLASFHYFKLEVERKNYDKNF